MSSIGSKALSSGGSKSCFSRSAGASNNANSRALVNEDDYCASSDSWLIDDMTRSKPTLNINRKELNTFTSGTSSRNKRKHAASGSSYEIEEMDGEDYQKSDDFNIDDVLMDFENVNTVKPSTHKAIESTRSNDPIILDDERTEKSITTSMMRMSNKKAGSVSSWLASSSSKKRILDNDVVVVSDHHNTANADLQEARKNISFPNKENVETST